MDETKKCFGPLNGWHVSVVAATRRVCLVVNMWHYGETGKTVSVNRRHMISGFVTSQLIWQMCSCPQICIVTVEIEIYRKQELLLYTQISYIHKNREMETLSMSLFDSHIFVYRNV